MNRNTFCTEIMLVLNRNGVFIALSLPPPPPVYLHLMELLCRDEVQQPEQDASALEASVDLFLLLASLSGHHTGLQVGRFDVFRMLGCKV